MKNFFCAFVLAACLGAQDAAAPASHLLRITADALKADVSWLASDELEGRATPSPGLDKAAAFLAARHEALGLKPLFGEARLEGPNRPDLDAANARLVTAEGASTLTSTRFLNKASQPLALKGIAVVRTTAADTSNAPIGTAPTALLCAEALTRDALARLARRRPAAILITEPPAELPRLRMPLLRVTPEEAAHCIDGTLLDLEIPESKERFASNVGSFLPGNDPVLKNSALLVTAHYDHIGTGPAVDGDRIRNGADDDASGTSAALAIALALKDRPLKRSVLFVHFYGEESGFLGSRRFVEHPPWPLKNMDAMFNLEMVGRPDDIGKDCAWVTGWSLSDFGARVAAVSATQGIRCYEHPRLSKMLFGGSDNFPFAEKGVVAHSISAGSLHKQYHQPGDEASTLDYENMARVVRGIAAAVEAMANDTLAPTFNPGTNWAEAATRR